MENIFRRFYENFFYEKYFPKKTSSKKYFFGIYLKKTFSKIKLFSGKQTEPKVIFKF